MAQHLIKHISYEFNLFLKMNYLNFSLSISQTKRCGTQISRLNTQCFEDLAVCVGKGVS